MLKQEIKTAILELQKQYPEKRSALIPALHLAQRQEGYLPLAIQEDVAKLFAIDVNEVQAIVTFYDMFFDKPVGKHILHICKNVSCMLRGGDEVMEKFCHRLNISSGETTADGEFTIIASECLGACDRAPMMLADAEVVGPIDPEKIEEILAKTKQGHGHPSPMDNL
jgi:NADH-quinone oxidoreductase subunit E